MRKQVQMAMIIFLFRGILIGLIFGIPAGAVGALTVQRTLQYGVRAGLFTGLGSSVADCIYAGIGAFGLKLISDILLKSQNVIHCGGACFICMMGILFLIRKPENIGNTVEKAKVFQMFLSSFLIGITNPAAILTFLLAFSWFGIAGNTGHREGILLVAGVFVGTYIWWSALVFITEYLKKRNQNINWEKLNKIFGILLMILGGGIFAEFLAVHLL